MDLTRAQLFRGLIFSLSSAFAIGLLGILGKIGYKAGMDEAELLQSRWFFGAALLFIYLFLTDRSSLLVSGTTLLKAAILGAFFHGIAGICFFRAIRYIPVSTTLLIVYFYPVVVTVSCALLFKMRLSRTVLFSLGFIVLGCSLVFFDAFLQDFSMQGIAYAVLNMIVFSGYLVVAQLFLRGEKPLVLTFYMALCTAFLFSFFSSPLKILAFQPNQLLISLSLGLFPSALAYFFSFRAIETVGSGYVSIFSTFEPVTAVFLSFLVLGEAFFLYQLIGMALIICGIVLPNVMSLRTGDTQSRPAKP